MVTVHFWPGATVIIEAEVSAPLHWFYFVFIDCLGRASVPLLSFFSGMLFAITFAKTDNDAELVLRKAMTLMWPLFFWSVPMVVIGYAEGVLKGEGINVCQSTMCWLKELFGIGGNPANAPLHFLRDIFVTSIYVVIFLRLYKYNSVLSLLFLSFAFVVEGMLGIGLVSRVHIFNFFLCGVIMHLTGQSNWKPEWSLIAFVFFIWVLALGIVSAFELSAEPTANFLTSHLSRLTMSLLVWGITVYCLRHLPSITAGLKFLEPRIFTIFTSHMLTTSVMGGVAFFTGLTVTSLLYFPFFVLQMIVVVGVGCFMQPLMSYVPYATGKPAKRYGGANQS